MMTQQGTYKKLIVWQKAMDLVDEVYQLTDQFPAAERFGLLSQMRRSAVSIPSNIAEGRRRGSEKEFRQFVRIAFGSGAELETQIEISKRRRFADAGSYEKLDSLLEEVMKMLNRLCG